MRAAQHRRFCSSPTWFLYSSGRFFAIAKELFGSGTRSPRIVNDDPAQECRFLVTADSGDPHQRSVSLFSVETSERVGSAIPAIRAVPYARHAAIPHATATKADPAETTTAH